MLANELYCPLNFNVDKLILSCAAYSTTNQSLTSAGDHQALIQVLSKLPVCYNIVVSCQLIGNPPVCKLLTTFH